MTENNIAPNQLPMKFSAKYLGARRAQGLWGIKHTRQPVDELVESAKNSPSSHLTQVEIEISFEGIRIAHVGDQSALPIKYGIDSISYGVQDVTFTRVFCMIVCSQEDESHPFMCHAFACDSKHTARSLTFALSAAFTHYADEVRAGEKDKLTIKAAIDLRTREQIDANECSETDA